MINLFFDIGITVLLLIIIKKIINMPTKEEFAAAFAEVNEATTNIAADIERLTSQIGSGGLSEADEAAALAELQGIATRLKDIAATTPDGEPTPPVEG